MPFADTPRIDLAAYLQRIGIAATVRPDLTTLRAILQAHSDAIPFENLDPFLGEPVSLDLDAVQGKLVQAGRGGYCFEQNLLLGDTLRAMGFRVTNLAARVLWGQPDDAITARSHMLLCIDMDDGVWLADVGFGGMTPSGPLQLATDIEQATPHESFRLLHDDTDNWRMQALVHDTWKTLYRFDLQPQFPIDYLASNYWLSNRADSHFVANLIASRAPPGRRLALRNRVFSVHMTRGKTEQQTLRSTTEIKAVLADQFLIRLPDHPALEERLDHLPPTGSDSNISR